MKKILVRVAAVFGALMLLLIIIGMLTPSDKVVVDELAVLKDGESRIWKLDPGSYKVEMTASDDGAQVRWIGSSCGASGQVNELQTACRLEKTGQLVVENPTDLGLGASVSATVKVTRLGRDI